MLFCFGLQQAGSIGNQVVENGGQTGTKLGIENLQILFNLIHGYLVRPGWVDQGGSRVYSDYIIDDTLSLLFLSPDIS